MAPIACLTRRETVEEVRRTFLAAAILAVACLPPVLAEPQAGEPSAQEGFGEPAFEAIGLRQGLTSGAIFAVLVDRHGFVWFAGDRGIHRFDGQHVLTLDRDPGRADTLASRTNAALAETGDAIWALSFGGLLQRIDAQSGGFSALTLRRGERQAGRGTSMVADPTGRLWIGTDIGLFRLDRGSASAVTVALPPPETRVTTVELDDDGTTVLAGTVDGRVLRVDLQRPERAEPLAQLSEGGQTVVPLAIATASDALWLGTNLGLRRLDLASGALAAPALPADQLRGRIDDLELGRDGVLWAGGQNRAGLLRFDTRTGASTVYRHHPDDPYSLAADRVFALALDGRGNLWLGLQREGAARVAVDQPGAGRYRATGGAGDSFCAVRDLAAAGPSGETPAGPSGSGPGRLLVALCGGSIGILDPRSGAFEDRFADLAPALDHPLPTPNSHALVADGAGGYFVTTGNLGLLRWWPDQHRAVRYPLVDAGGRPLPYPYMNEALLDRRGRLWVASSLGLACLLPGDDSLRLLDREGEPGRLLTGGALELAEAPDGALWIGTTQGLLHYAPPADGVDGGRVVRYRHRAADPTSLSDDLVMALHVDPRGALWVGTEAGLNRLVDGAGTAGRFQRYGVDDGLPDQSIAAIVDDQAGSLWVGTYRGIARLDDQQRRFRPFLPAEGVPDSQVNRRAALVTADGSLWFGTASGLLRLLPARLRVAEPQALTLGSWELGGRTHLNLRGPDVPPLHTGYTEGRVRFNVAAFSDHRRLSYRLRGLERDWRPMPASLSIGYDPLPPGDYRFEVRQLSSAGEWQAPALRVPLVVAAPPWRTPMAWALYALAAVLACAALAVVLRARRAREARHVRELIHLASYDALTGLPNRTLFTEELEARLLGGAPAPLALLFIDLDRFKNINDSLGHGFGDLVLLAAANRLREALHGEARAGRQSSGALLSRLGGDEFTVLLPDVADAAAAGAVAESLLAAFNTPLRVEGSAVVATLSIGIALHPAHASAATTLVQYADSAMYHAKAAGRNTWRLFAPRMVAEVTRRLALETSLRQAMESGELYSVYQPQIDLRSGRICGAEMLLRWQSAEHGAVPPAEFVPILEDTGMIEGVGLWLAEQACRQVLTWSAAGIEAPTLAVNVSVHQLMRGELVSRLAALARELALPAGALELEVTESALMENAERIGATLGELRTLGLGLAIDDFGTGYSSFASLSALPVDKLKIDRTFIAGVGSEASSDTLCAAIIAMAHNLELTVVAEGVESERQHLHLAAMGCDQAQGYWYRPPVALAELEALLRSQQAQAPRAENSHRSRSGDEA